MVDADVSKIRELVEARLPQTFTVKTAHGIHFYFKTEKPYHGSSPLGVGGEFGHIRGTGGQVVAPGSTHESGIKYTVDNDVPIAEVTVAQIQSTFGEFLERPHFKEEAEPGVVEKDVFKLAKSTDISRYIPEATKGKRYVNGIRCPNHADVPPYDLCVWPDTSSVYCWACGWHGSIIDYVAKVNGLAPLEAAKKICEENGIQIPLSTIPTGKVYDWTIETNQFKVRPLPLRGKNKPRFVIEKVEKGKVVWKEEAPDNFWLKDSWKRKIAGQANTNLNDLEPEFINFDKKFSDWKDTIQEPEENLVWKGEVNGKVFHEVFKEGTPCFCLFDGNSITLVDAVEIEVNESKKVLHPLNGEELTKGFLKLPEHAESHESISKLVREIILFSRKYVDVSEDFRIFCCYYVLFTWVSDALNTTPYLRFLGDTGCGKSRALHVFGVICHNFIPVSGAATIAPIYRIIDRWHPTLGFEESDLKGSDETNELVKIINCGIERGNPILRCDPNDPARINFFDPFCPKIFAARHNFDDNATEGRCLTETMKETERTDLPIELPDEFFEEARHLRNKLLDFRLRNFQKIKSETSLDIDDVEPRLKQMALPLLPLFVEDEVARKQFLDFVHGYQQKLLEIRAASWPGQILQAIVDFLNEENDKEELPKLVTCKNIATKFGVSVADVSRETRALGFATEIRHLSFADTSGKSKRKTFRALYCSATSWTTLSKRYFPKSSRIPQPYQLVSIKKEIGDSQSDVPVVPSVPHPPEDPQKALFPEGYDESGTVGTHGTLKGEEGYPKNDSEVGSDA